MSGSGEIQKAEYFQPRPSPSSAKRIQRRPLGDFTPTGGWPWAESAYGSSKFTFLTQNPSQTIFCPIPKGKEGEFSKDQPRLVSPPLGCERAAAAGVTSAAMSATRFNQYLSIWTEKEWTVAFQTEFCLPFDTFLYFFWHPLTIMDIYVHGSLCIAHHPSRAPLHSQ